MGKHTKKKINVKRIMYLILIIIFLCGSIYIGKYFYDRYKNNKAKNVLDTISIDNSKVTEEKTERILKLEELQKENSDIIGYLEIDGTNISYPVLQTTDNDFYLSHNYKKEKTSGGSLFLDKDFDIEKPSSNYLIYGHRMKDGTMFEDLIKYKEESFYKEHPTIKFTTNSEDAEYEIIAVFESRVYYKSESNVFRYYYFINAENEQEFNDYVESSKKESLYDTGKTVKYGEQLLTLSTCSYHTEDGRLAVVARKIK